MNNKLLCLVFLASILRAQSGSMFLESYGVKQPYQGPSFKIKIDQKEEQLIEEQSSDKTRPVQKKRTVTKKSHKSMDAGEALAYMVRAHDKSVIDMLDDTKAIDFITDEGMRIAHKQVDRSTTLQRSKWYTFMVSSFGIVAGSFLGYCISKSPDNREEQSTHSNVAGAVLGGMVGGIGGFCHAYIAKNKAIAVYDYVMKECKKRFSK